MNWKQTYVSGNAYGLNDAVSYNGSAYISLIPINSNNEPDISPTAWSLLAQQGAAGAQGLQGIPGTPGANGSAGPQGLAGPAGPAGTPGSPTILNGYCSGTLPDGILTGQSGVLIGLGDDSPAASSQCFNGDGVNNVVGIPIPSLGNLNNLTVIANASSVSGYTIQITVFLNANATSLSCAISVAPQSSGLLTCSAPGPIPVATGQPVFVQASISGIGVGSLGSLTIHASLEK